MLVIPSLTECNLVCCQRCVNKLVFFFSEVMLRKVFAFLLSLAISLEDKSLVQRGKSRSL